MLNEVAHILHRQRLAEVLYARISGKLGEVGKRHALFELRQTGSVYLAVFDVLNVGENVFREQLAA